jgi:hypothetical protein
MIYKGFSLLTALLLVLNIALSAQQTAEFSADIPNKSSIHIVLAAPLYLDSAMKVLPYGPIKKFPKFILPGLEFVQGAEIALDSFSFPNTNIALSIIDTRIPQAKLDSVLKVLALKKIDGILAPVKDPELSQIATFAMERKIPCWSMVYPNDAGVSNNPFFAVLNPTLKTHCEAIFSYLLQTKISQEHIYLVQPTGAQEDRVSGYIKAINETDNQQLLEYKQITLDSNYNNFLLKLDSNQSNIIILGSLDEDYVTGLIKWMVPFRKQYDIKVFGMPNWENFSVFSKKSKSFVRDFPVIFTNSYFNNRADSTSLWLQDVYLAKYKGKPSDFAYKGMEAILQFAEYLLKGKSTFGPSSYSFYSKPNLVPVKKNVNAGIDYLENKHLFFIRRLNGVSSLAW